MNVHYIKLIIDILYGFDIMASTRQRNQPNAPKRCKGANKMNTNIIHQQLRGDLAYQYSVENNDIFNMMATLKAHGLESTFSAAELQVQYGQIVAA